MALRQLLRLIEQLQRLGKALAHAQAFREPDLGPAARRIVRRRGEGETVGRDRGGGVAEIALEVALQTDQRMTVGVGPCDRKPASGKPQRGVRIMDAALRERGLQIGLRRPIVLGAVEMLRMQRQVPVGEPLGRLQMQLAPAGSEQGGVGSLLDQGVREQIILALRQHQCIADEAVAGVVGRADEPPQQRQGEPLANDGRGLERLPVARRQPVHARQHQALDGSGHSVLAAFLRAAQQLLQKQRVAGGAFDAGKRDALRRVDEAAGEAQRLVVPQRTEVDGFERRAAAACAPCEVERVALDARGHDQQPRTVGNGGRQRRKMREDLRIGPMQILDDQQRRAVPAGICGERGGERALAAVAGGVVHRIVERAPFGGLGQVKQVVEKYAPIRRHHALGDKTLRRAQPLRRIGCRRQAEQALQQRADRVLAFADAEIEHQRAVDREALRVGVSPHFLDEARLADAGFTSHENNPAGTPAEAGANDAPELLELGLAANEGAAAREYGIAGDAAQPPDAGGRAQSLERHLPERVAHAAAAKRALDPVGDHGQSRCGDTNEPRREIHRIAEHGVVVRGGAANGAGHHLAAGDPHMRLDRVACRLVRPRQRLVDVERGAGGAERVVVMRPRRAEQRHDGVPDVLVDRAAVADDDAVDERREAGNELAHLLRIKLLRQCGEPGDVGEQDGDLAALAGLRAHGLARRLCGRRAALGDRRQQALAEAERGDAELLQIGIGQLDQHAEIDVVLGKALGVLGHPELFEPVLYLLHHHPAPG